MHIKISSFDESVYDYIQNKITKFDILTEMNHSIDYKANFYRTKVKEILSKFEGINKKVLAHGGGDKPYLRVEAPFYSDSLGEHYLFDNCMVTHKASDKIIEFYYSDMNALRFPVKSFITQYLKSLGYLFLHGAAFSFKDKGYILAGNKGAGKTTTIMSLLANNHPHLGLISNDRIAFDSKNSLIYRIDNTIRFTKETYMELKKYYGLDNLVVDCMEKNRIINPKYEKESLDILHLENSGVKVTPSVTLDKIFICDFVEGLNDEDTGIYKSNISLKELIIEDEDEHPNWLNFKQKNETDINYEMYSVFNFRFSDNMLFSSNYLLDNILKMKKL